MLLFLDFREETRKLLGPGTLAEGALTMTYSTRPSSTTFEIQDPPARCFQPQSLVTGKMLHP